MGNPITAANQDIPAGAVAGLSDILLALGDELRKANRTIGEFSYPNADGTSEVQPILFLNSATVELSIDVTADAHGGVKVWVLGAETGASAHRAGKVTVSLNTDGTQPAFGVGM